MLENIFHQPTKCTVCLVFFIFQNKTFRSVSVLPPIVDQRKRRVEHISTILCIVLFIILLAFPAYIIWKRVKKSDNIKTVTILAPTMEQYSQLQFAYFDTLKCSCTQFAIDYSRFIYIQPTFHQICSSIFVSQVWISSLNTPHASTLFLNDFRMTSPYVFQTLSKLCELAQMAVLNNLNQFYSNQYVSISLLPTELFQTQTTLQIQQFIHSVTENFLFIFSMIHSSISNNVLLSALHTNYRQYVQNNSVFSMGSEYNGCSCAISSACTVQSAIYQYPQGPKLFDIPGFYTGCYVIESLLRSNLQCFYDQTCLDQLQTYLSSPIPMSSLNSSTSRFSRNSSIGDLLHELMIEGWESRISYTHYYEACQPIQCSYTTTESTKTTKKVEIKDDVLYLIGLLVGIIGGYIAILNLIIPRVVKVIVFGFRTQQIQVIS